GMALVRLDTGDAEAAVELGEEALAASREGFSPIIGGYALAAWGAAQAAFGDRGQGVERVHEAAGLFSRIGYHGGAAECWWRLSRISVDRGDCSDAVTCAEQAVACADQGDDVLARRLARQQLDAARRLAGRSPARATRTDTDHVQAASQRCASGSPHTDGDQTCPAEEPAMSHLTTRSAEEPVPTGDRFAAHVGVEVQRHRAGPGGCVATAILEDPPPWLAPGEPAAAPVVPTGA